MTTPAITFAKSQAREQLDAAREKIRRVQDCMTWHEPRPIESDIDDILEAVDNIEAALRLIVEAL